MKRTSKVLIPVAAAVVLGACNLFEPREAEPPSQSGFQYLPRTFPSNVILNLQNAVEQKDVAGYVACLTDSTRSRYNYTFVPSADAAEIYGTVLRNWTLQHEQEYFQNLVAKRRQPVSISRLDLMPIDSVISGNDTRTYSYDYTFTFEHTEPGFTSIARGSVQFTLVNDNSEWTISRWVDLKTTSSLTWSSFKGKFSN
ncbi:MAG TPA: hypothetical protein VNL69_10090 [Bacteroidota bacterium]|nr:hypothetical protein [Bacteroidota bacterium]